MDIYEKILRQAFDILISEIKKIDSGLFVSNNKGIPKDYCQTIIFDTLEKTRYLKIISYIDKNVSKENKILDLGTFFAIIPVSLRLLGYKNIDIMDDPKLFKNNCTASYIDFLKNHFGLQFKDFNSLNEFKSNYDVITFTSVIEHINDTPKPVLQNIWQALKNEGELILDTPNLLSLRKRIMFLLGRPLYEKIVNFFNSESPYSGHYREYSFKEIKYMLETIGFQIKHNEFFNLTDKRTLFKSFVRFLSSLSANFKELIFVIAKK